MKPPKCKTCKDTGRVISRGAWNITLQEHTACPDCKVKAKDRPKIDNLRGIE